MKNLQKKQLVVVGIGPGNSACCTKDALDALEKSSCIVGYPLYLNLLPAELKQSKTIIATGMRQEKDRCEKAIAKALEGEPTAIICSGDPGIYALAGLVLELLERDNLLTEINLSIIPGVPALCACAALLGAPLTHDFACVSLSDLLTPWNRIEKRLTAALAADFVLVIYNPRSKNRPDLLAKAISLAKSYRQGDCPVGLVQNAYRTGQRTAIVPLSNFVCESVDMLSLVIIGNTESRRAGPYMLTPRGYSLQQS